MNLGGLGEGIGSGTDSFFEQRIWVAAAGIAAVFAIFLVRLFQLQVVQGEEHRLSSLRNSIRTVRLEAPRGEILDREGRVLATTRPAFHLEVVPHEVRAPERSFPLVAALLEGEADGLAERVAERRGRLRFQPLRLAEDLSWEHLARIESHRYALPGFFTEVRPRRFYPEGGLAAHLLGTIGEVRPEQLERRDFSGYRPGDVAGQGGVEAVLESHLRGRAGGRNVVVDVSGREVEVLDQMEPRPGGNARLALDMDLQRVAEEAFLPAEPEGEPLSGALVALDPRNGDVLALVSAPAFDPNDFAGGVDAATWRALTEHPERPLQNRALAGQYPPGSTYKAFLAAAALEAGVVGGGSRVFCPGRFTLGRRTYRCWRREGHGDVDVHRALVQSCDVYFYRTGLSLGIDRLAEFARAFGLGALTGIALPGEQPGLVPTSDWKKRRFGEPWMLGETVSASIGQGFNLTTPLQLAVSYAAIANGGRVLRPRLVLERVHPDGSVEREPTEVIGRVPVSLEHLERVRSALDAVVNEPQGTGRRAQVPGLRVAGKTGTSQVVRLEQVERFAKHEIPRQYRDHAWFAAFAPTEGAEIAVAVLVEHGGGGGANAAPIAQRVLARWWEKRSGVPLEPGPETPVREAALRAGTEAPRVGD